MQASDVMTRDVVTVGPLTQVNEIVELLNKHNISGMPVVDDQNRVIGMISEGDLLRRVENNTVRRDRSWLAALFSSEDSAANYVRTHGRRAESLMTRDPVTITENEPLYRIAQLFEKRRIKRVPVTRDGKLVGLVSRGNLLQGFSSSAQDEEAATVDDREIRNEILAQFRELGISDNTTNAVVTDGVVDLWGFVENEVQLRAARIAASRARGVKDVRSHLTAK
ncbi:MAG TPA: CBS domain-containing protein [Azoarcus sp.]|nr:CBS domain-containing protein [Azoarcus sp.]